jgi:hypothetical protein
MTLCFYWIIAGMGETIVQLEERRQHYKLAMYMWLRRVLILSMVIIFLGTLIFGVKLASMLLNVESFSSGWQSLWFFESGWTKIVFLVSFLSVAWLWRPTKNNQRYGLEQLPDDDGIDLEATGGGAGSNRGHSDIHWRNGGGPGEGSDFDGVGDQHKPDVLFDASDHERSPVNTIGGSASPGGKTLTAQQVYAIGDDLGESGTDDEASDQKALRIQEQSKMN